MRLAICITARYTSTLRTEHHGLIQFAKHKYSRKSHEYLHAALLNSHNHDCLLVWKPRWRSRGN